MGDSVTDTGVAEHTQVADTWLSSSEQHAVSGNRIPVDCRSPLFGTRRVGTEVQATISVCAPYGPQSIISVYDQSLSLCKDEQKHCVHTR
jgi:hypothetical protein